MSADMKLLFISGNWTEDGGRSSYYMDKVIHSFETRLGHPIRAFNGGDISVLPNILRENVPNCDVVFWSPNIPKELNVRINPKDYNSKIVLITFKRNDDRYTFEDMISKSIASRSDLTCEVRKNDSGRYEMRVYDILGTLWSDFTVNTQSSVNVLVNRSISLLGFTYYKLSSRRTPIYCTNDDLDDIFETYKDFGNILHDIQFPDTKKIKRHLGELSFRGKSSNGSHNDLIYSNSRNYRMSDELDITELVASKILNGKVNYYGTKKPNLQAGVFDKVMLKYPDINYIFHSHCYIRDARFTERAVATGCTQEYDEIVKVIESYGLKTDICVNLLGHGSLIMGNSLDYVKSRFPDLVKRESPEPLGVEFNIVEVDDGYEKFINILNNKPILDGERLEIQFNDGTLGTYDVNVNEYTDDIGRPHSDAIINLTTKGIELQVPLTGLLVRRV